MRILKTRRLPHGLGSVLAKAATDANGVRHPAGTVIHLVCGGALNSGPMGAAYQDATIKGVTVRFVA